MGWDHEDKVPRRGRNTEVDERVMELGRVDIRGAPESHPAGERLLKNWHSYRSPAQVPGAPGRCLAPGETGVALDGL